MFINRSAFDSLMAFRYFWVMRQSITQFAILIFFAITAQNLFAQISKKYNFPSFVQVDDTLFVSRFEVSIRDYAAFLLYIRLIKKDSLFAEQCLPKPNTTDWMLWNSYSKSLVTFDNPMYEFPDSTVSFKTAMGDFPVVNVSNTQAAAFCDFKNLDYQIFLKKAKEKQKKKQPSNLFYRLLTEKEWTKAAGVTSDTSNIMSLQYFENKSLKDRRPTSVFFGSVNKNWLGEYGGQRCLISGR